MHIRHQTLFSTLPHLCHRASVAHLPSCVTPGKNWQFSYLYGTWYPFVKNTLIGPLSRRHSFCLFCQYLAHLPTTNPGYTTSLRISWEISLQDYVAGFAILQHINWRTIKWNIIKQGTFLWRVGKEKSKYQGDVKHDDR